MADDQVQAAQDKILEDEDTMERFKQAPHEVLKDHGIELDRDQREKLAAQNLQEMENEAVRHRIREHGLGAMY